MLREEIYQAWLPTESIWSLWGRPVLFAQMPADVGDPSTIAAASDNLGWVPEPSRGSLVILDLAGDRSIRLGLALAPLGYRPVPLFNGCTGTNEIIDMGSVLQGLQAGARSLGNLMLTRTAPPVFLLDSRRHGVATSPLPGQFDNRWQVMPQDFPSADYLKSQGILSALLIQEGLHTPAEDLTHVLRRWQEAGLLLRTLDLTHDGNAIPLLVDRPRGYLNWSNQILPGLLRNPLGGFGNIVPEPHQG
jgi:hypothetical protein